MTAVAIDSGEALGRLFSSNVQSHLDRLGWSRGDLARAARMSRATVYSHLVEARCPRIDTAHRIAQAFDTTIDELCDPNGAQSAEEPA